MKNQVIPIKIIYDDIIYSLQKSGGISLYWSQLEKYKEQDIKLVYKDCEKNIFYQESLSSKKINSIIFLERFKNISLDIKSPFIFHSSYYRYCKNKNAINITTVHDFIYEYFRSDLKSILHKIQKRNAIKNSYAIICNSNNTKKDFLKFFPDFKGKIKVIYSGLSDDYYNMNIPRKNNVIFMGPREGYKNFNYALKLMENFPELKLQIISGGLLKKNEYMILENTIPNRYEYYSSLSNMELNKFYNEAKFLLYTSLYEGFGVPVLEAQATGCPVVCCNVSALSEVAGESAFYISGKSIEEDLKVISMLENKEVYDIKIKKGFENSKKFSWKKCAEETYNFYMEVYDSNQT